MMVMRQNAVCGRRLPLYFPQTPRPSSIFLLPSYSLNAPSFSTSSLNPVEADSSQEDSITARIYAKKKRMAEIRVEKYMRKFESKKYKEQKLSEEQALVKEQEEGRFAEISGSLASRIGLDQEVVASALTHPSFRGLKGSNAQLEFLGDKIVNLIVSEIVVTRYPNAPLWAIHAAFTHFSCNGHLFRVGCNLGIKEFIRYQHRPPPEGFTDEDNPFTEAAVANAVEALAGAIYKNKGLKEVREWVTQHILPPIGEIDLIPYLKDRAPKHTLFQILQSQGLPRPYYRLLQESGRSSHKSAFVVGVFSDEKQVGVGSAPSLVQARANAAQDALNKVYAEKSYGKLPSE